MTQAVYNTSNTSSPIVFVLVERLHENGRATPSVLTSFANKHFFFADADTGCFDPAIIWKFNTIEQAQSVIELAWDLNETYLGIALYDADYPDEIDIFYTTYRIEKILEVVRNRLAEKK